MNDSGNHSNPKTQQDSRPGAVTPDLPEQRKSLAGTSADPILPLEASAGNHRGSEAMGAVLARVYRIVLEGARGQP